jgi:hypothetical protein
MSQRLSSPFLYPHNCDRDDVKAVVTSDLDVTANITAATASIRSSRRATSVGDAAITDATSVTIDAPQVNLTGDPALENVVANVSVTSPLVNATTKLVTPVIVVDTAVDNLTVSANEVTFNAINRCERRCRGLHVPTPDPPRR